MFVLYNAILRGSTSTVEVSGHRFTNTIHALASAIMKMQRLKAKEPSTTHYRGLAGLSVAAFAASCGFTDRAFRSTTQDRNIALLYSGIDRGLVGALLRIETSTHSNGVSINQFSQAQSLKSRLCSGMIVDVDVLLLRMPMYG